VARALLPCDMRCPSALAEVGTSLATMRHAMSERAGRGWHATCYHATCDVRARWPRLARDLLPCDIRCPNALAEVGTRLAVLCHAKHDCR
jgi:hypothetical protein